MLLLDIGNTATKWGICDSNGVVVEYGEQNTANWSSIVEMTQDKRAMIAASGGSYAKHRLALENLGVQCVRVDGSMPTLPITIDYATPDTLGADRIAAACGGYQMFHNACVIIDAGTCVTIDYIDRFGFYRGGAILPGVKMQLQAMNHNTAHLPSVKWEQDEICHQLGRTTHEAMLSGTVWGIRYAIAGYVAYYRNIDNAIPVVITGGCGKILSSEIADAVYDPLLVLKGLATIGRKI